MRRRLAQKLEFLLQDVATLQEPTVRPASGRLREKSQQLHRTGSPHILSYIYFSARKHTDAEQNAKRPPATPARQRTS